MNSVIEPSESRGYITWSKTPNTKYVIDLLEKDINGNLISVGSKSTTNNFARLLKSNYNSTNGLYYQISSYSEITGNLIDISEVQNYIGDQPQPQIICERKCNGSFYAWKLFITETTYGNTKMNLSSTLNYYDYSADVAVPFYFAMNLSTYNALPMGHPYNSYSSAGVPQYKRIQITPSTPGGPFYSPSNDVITSGYLIEKKMNQYDFMHGSVTNSNPPTATNCPDGVIVSDGGVWMQHYNTYYDPNSWQTIPGSVEPFAYTVPTQLGCDVLQTPTTSPTPSDVGEVATDVFSGCIWQSVSICDYLTCIGIDCEGNGNTNTSLSGMYIKQINDVHTPIELNFISGTGNYNLISSLPTGLYEITAFGTNGSVLPFIIENINETSTTQNRDFVTMTLTPTIIENNELFFTISSEKDLNAVVNVQSLDGTIYHSEALQLSSTLDSPLEVTINTSNIPYNQVKVNLVFDDGSIIQKTALKIN